MFISIKNKSVSYLKKKIIGQNHYGIIGNNLTINNQNIPFLHTNINLFNDISSIRIRLGQIIWKYYIQNIYMNKHNY